MHCPKCGSAQVHVVTDTVTRGKDFSGCLACIGVLLFHWIGLMCGFCGGGKEVRTKTRFICQSCGKRF